MHISELAIYPLKSARQMRVEEMPLTALGPDWDRRWMLVDADGVCVTQRMHARLCLLSATIKNGHLVLSAPGFAEFVVQVVGVPQTLRVTIWEDTVLAEAVSPLADIWCSEFLDRPVRLVFMPESTPRSVNPQYAGLGHYTAFSDGFPLLLVTQPSLDHLNNQLPAAVDWRRFRPNIVLGGGMAAHAEDGWKRLRLGEIELAVVKPCSRCVIPSVDPETAVKNSRILTVLRSYRAREDGKTYFGQNVIITKMPRKGCLRVGDPVIVLA